MTFRLHCPLLVSQDSRSAKSEFTVRPLFFPRPVVKHRRYEAALALIRQEMKERFKLIKLNKDNLEQVLWFAFYPKDLQHHIHEYRFIVGKKRL